MTCWQALGNAIVAQAAKDYLRELRTLKRHPNCFACKQQALALEKFFYSDWYDLLTDVNPDYLIQRLRRKVVH